MSRTAAPLKVDRHKQILAIVNTQKRISLMDLEAVLRTPRITIQRDLVELENRSLLRRFHGGVMSNDFSGDFYNYDMKKNVRIESKKKIAAKANRLLRENSTVCLDASSTVYYLSETMFPANMTVLACSIDAFKNLSNRDDLQVVLGGGRFHRKTATLYGPELIAAIRKFHFDMAFISAESFIPGRGFFDPHEEEVAVKRALIESSENTVLMIDSSKFAPAAGIQVCENDDITWVITDSPDMASMRKMFRNRLM
jgi:DeoR/GlpR family transcriptional regulator of sugar metabolism